MPSINDIRIPVAQFQFRDRVMVRPHEAEIAPFEAIITGVNFSHRKDGDVRYTITEADGSESDGWTDDFLTRA